MPPNGPASPSDQAIVRIERFLGGPRRAAYPGDSGPREDLRARSDSAFRGG